MNASGVCCSDSETQTTSVPMLKDEDKNSGDDKSAVGSGGIFGRVTPDPAIKMGHGITKGVGDYGNYWRANGKRINTHHENGGYFGGFISAVTLVLPAGTYHTQARGASSNGDRFELYVGGKRIMRCGGWYGRCKNKDFKLTKPTWVGVRFIANAGDNTSDYYGYIWRD